MTGALFGPILDVVWKALLWWRDGLLAFFPDQAQQRLTGRAQEQVIRLTPDGTLVWADEVTTERSASPSTPAMRLHLDPALCLSVPLTLPTASKRDLERAIALEAERHIPLPVHEVLFGYTILDTADEASDTESPKTSELLLAAIKERDIAPVLQTLSDQGHRIVEASVQFEDWDAHVDLLPHPYRSQSRNRDLRITALGLAALVALLLAPGTYASRVERANSELEAEVAALSQTARPIIEAGRLAEEAVVKATSLKSIERQDRVLALVAELAKAAPDTVMIRDLRYDAGSLRVTGTADAAADWVLALQVVPMFRTAQLQSVSEADANGRERFDLTLQVQAQP